MRGWKVKSAKKQAGLSLAEVSISLLIVSIIYLGFIRTMADTANASEAATIRARLEYVVDNIQRYYMVQIIVSGLSPSDSDAYPDSLEALELLGGYIEECDEENVKDGLCFDYKYLPIGNGDDGEEIIYTRETDSNGYPQFTLAFSLATMPDSRKYNALYKELSQIPSFTIDSSDNVTLTYTRPANAVHLENLVARDGSTEMTDDWDYGGYDINDIRYINNVSNISINGMDDLTVVSGLSRTGVAYVTTSSGISVDKLTCPTGYDSKIAVWAGSVGGDETLYDTRNVSAWAIESTSSWTLYYRVAALESADDDVWDWHYKGTVGYSLSCG
jgi:competence protein ComGC